MKRAQKTGASAGSFLLQSLSKRGRAFRHYLIKSLSQNGALYSLRLLPEDRKIVSEGRDFIRHRSLELMAYEIERNHVPGDVAELGVFRGEFARRINALFPSRNLYLFDTFEGFDNRDISTDVNNNYSTGSEDFSNTSVQEVLSVMPHPEKCVIRKGWFPQTTEGLENLTFSCVSIDADLFEPIYAGLEYFYPRLSRGGAIFVHDFNSKLYQGSGAAVRKYCAEHMAPYFCIPDICGSAVVLK